MTDVKHIQLPKSPEANYTPEERRLISEQPSFLSSGDEGSISSKFNRTDSHRKDIESLQVSVIYNARAKLLLRYTIFCILAVVVGMVAGYVAVYIVQLKDSYSQSNGSTRSLSAHKDEKQTTPWYSVYLKNSNHQELRVASYMEFQAKMFDIKAKTPVHLQINVESKNDWLTHGPLYKSHQVTSLHLQGRFDIDILKFLLENLSNLSHLNVDNSENESCSNCCADASKSNAKPKKVSTPRLRELTVHNFVKCSSFLNSISNLMDAKELHTLRVDHGVVDSENINAIYSFIKIASKTLKKLYFPMTTWDTSFFEEDFIKLPNLTKLRIDFFSGYKQEKFIEADIKTKFPKLESFVSMHGYCPWPDFKNILGSPSLKKLETAIEIPENSSEMKVFFQDNDFYFIEYAELSVRFEKVTKTMPCPMEQISDLKASFKQLRIQYDCEVKDNLPMATNFQSAKILFG